MNKKVLTAVVAALLGNCSLPAFAEAADSGVSAAELLKRMTLEEKVGQIRQVFYFGGKPTEDLIRTGQVGSVLFVSQPEQVNRLQRMAIEESRLHIPLLFGFDVIHGLRTIFPVPLGMAASWDPAMVEAAQSTAAQEARAVGIHWTFAPMVDIARDARWGRVVEGAGEDPFLGSVLAAAQVRGFQGGHSVQPGHIIAGPKHFAGYGAAPGGRDYDEVNLSDAELWNLYLPPFKAAIDAGAGNIMSAYTGLNGVPAAANRWLLTDVLRKTWKFDGFVVTDANGVRNLTTQGLAADAEDAAVRAITAGVDMEMSIGKSTFAELVQAVADGRISQHSIDTAALRVLRAKIAIGLFAHPYVDEADAARIITAPEHRVQARLAAERSAVLLQNRGHTLPLVRSKIRSLALIGPFADVPREMLGPWVFAHNLAETVTIAAGLREAAGADIRIEVAQGVQPPRRRFPSPFRALDRGPTVKPWTEEEGATEFATAQAIAKAADVIVLTLGQTWDMSGEAASVSNLDLAAEQQRLLAAMIATGKPIVLVLVNGRPIDIRSALEHVPAVLEVWHPGTEGGAAVARLLFGDCVPGGKLPLTWPRSAGQAPLFYAHALSHEPQNSAKRYWDEDGLPLFPFGYGLSYTTFTFSQPRVERNTIRLGESLRVSVDVTNTGERAGDEVAQLYIHQRAGRATRPVRELKGFERVTLAPNQTRSLSFEIPPESLKYWSAADRTWVQDVSAFDLWVGSDSIADTHAEFEVIR